MIAVVAEGQTDLERVLGWALSESPSGCRGSTAAIFRDAAAAIGSFGPPYVIAGTVAFGLYASARTTNEISFVLGRRASVTVQHALGNAGFYQQSEGPELTTLVCPTTGIQMQLIARVNAAGHAALHDPARYRAFGVTVPVIKPEYLVWMCCRSATARAFADAVELLKSGRVDFERLRGLLIRSGDRSAHASVRRAVERAAAERHSSYSGSVARRQRVGR